jgi:hypothetical protein
MNGPFGGYGVHKNAIARHEDKAMAASCYSDAV